MEIWDEIIMISPRKMVEAYQCALRVEEKLLRKKNFNKVRGATMEDESLQPKKESPTTQIKMSSKIEEVN